MTAARGRALVALARQSRTVQRIIPAAQQSSVFVLVKHGGELFAVSVAGCGRGNVYVAFDGERCEADFSADFLREAFAA